MDIHNVIVRALHENLAEFTDDQAEAVIKAINDAGFVLVDKSHTEDWYLDPYEHMWLEQDGIDGLLSELDIGDVEAIEHKEYLITKNTPVFAAKVWDDSSNEIGNWQFFDDKEDAQKAADYCKAKFDEEY